MLRSLFAGISGLRVNQTMLDVTGNNIANANTTGYKASTTVFQDTLSQMMAGGTAANAERGGTNPVQVGLGVQLSATSTNFGQGSAQMTGRNTDLMLQGDGFFVVQRGNEEMYTRAGAFTFDETGTLVTNSGARVQGYNINPDGTTDIAGGLVDMTMNVPPEPDDPALLERFRKGYASIDFGDPHALPPLGAQPAQRRQYR